MSKIAQTIYERTGTTKAVIQSRCEEYADMHQVQAGFFVTKCGLFAAAAMGIPKSALIEEDLIAIAYAAERYNIGTLTSWFRPYLVGTMGVKLMADGEIILFDGPDFITLNN